MPESFFVEPQSFEPQKSVSGVAHPRERVFLTGVEALAQLPLIQARFDHQRGLKTGGFISGYRGSPLGGFDKALWSLSDQLDEASIVFTPGINEDLAATAVLGSQQVGLLGPKGSFETEYQGVFGLWYGKGPGLDRSGDALKHGNAYGASPFGGVLVVAGDDHGGVSSSMPHQSDLAMQAWSMPILHPVGVSEYIEFGLYGWALSRFSGAWVGFKAISECVESARSLTLPAFPIEYKRPSTFQAPLSGLHMRLDDLPSLEIEKRLARKLDAVRAFAEANPIDQTINQPQDPKLGIVTVGKAHADLMEALRLFDLPLEALNQAGIAIRKIGLVFPLETTGARAFAQDKSALIVVEEKAPVVETQLKELFYNLPEARRPVILGKHNGAGERLFPAEGELRPLIVAAALIKALKAMQPEIAEALNLQARYERLTGMQSSSKNTSQKTTTGQKPRRAHFCSGCPHNLSTKVPEGSTAFAGIGCHFMASWMDRDTVGLTQMGGEGVNWLGLAPFTKTEHVFQNLGDGTYFHSGLLAIRQAVSARASITYKILFNDAVAMTGGQKVDGSITVPQMVAQLKAESVRHIDILCEDPNRYAMEEFGSGVFVHARDQLDPVQKRLREMPGVTALIYDQTCAAEKRRRRKKDPSLRPQKRVFINDLVCEGCGDCSTKSNCLSIAPLETEFGRKRHVDQSSCNTDLACVDGFCPSFVTVEGDGLKLKKPAIAQMSEDVLTAKVADLPMPDRKVGSRPYEIVIAGVGGTGVVTIGAIIARAAHLAGLTVSGLDFTGFAQKGGAVLSHIRLSSCADSLNQARIEPGQADALLACDLVVGTSTEPLNALAAGRSRVIANSQEIHTADFISDGEAQVDTGFLSALLKDKVGEEHFSALNSIEAASALMGDTVASNMIMLGFAWQKACIPLPIDAIEQAIEQNGVALSLNKRAFSWGRILAHDPDFIFNSVPEAKKGTRFKPAETLDEIIDRRFTFLTRYQDRAYAERFRKTVETAIQAETEASGTAGPFAEAVARSLFKVMAYKDEYEVARLYTESDFSKLLSETFEGPVKLSYHFAPPFMNGVGFISGEPKKWRFGSWIMPVMKGLAKLRRLRGTPFDPFGYMQERRSERALIEEFESQVAFLCQSLTIASLEQATKVAGLPMMIKGYGPVKARAIQAYKAQLSEENKMFTCP